MMLTVHSSLSRLQEAKYRTRHVFPPSYFASGKSSVQAQELYDLREESTLRELHDYLFRRYNLLDRVI
jgi:hypothetical protein